MVLEVRGSFDGSESRGWGSNAETVEDWARLGGVVRGHIVSYGVLWDCIGSYVVVWDHIGSGGIAWRIPGGMRNRPSARALGGLSRPPSPLPHRQAWDALRLEMAGPSLPQQSQAHHQQPLISKLDTAHLASEALTPRRPSVDRSLPPRPVSIPMLPVQPGLRTLWWAKLWQQGLTPWLPISGVR